MHKSNEPQEAERLVTSAGKFALDSRSELLLPPSVAPIRRTARCAEVNIMNIE